jgi:hypothetical protein
VGEEAINFRTVGNYIIHNLTNDNVRNISADTVYSIAECDYRINIPPKSEISIRVLGKLSDGATFNQKDHLSIDKRHKSDLMDARSYRGVNIDSDHYLFIARLRAGL